MMRLTMVVWWSLALVWLVTSQAGAEPADGQRARLVDVTGYGLSGEAAQKDAHRKALEHLHIELRRQQLDHWRPTDADLQPLLENRGRAGADLRAGDNLPLSKTWLLTLKLPSPDELRQYDRQALRSATAEERMSVALRVVAALALVLSVLVGGNRLDEWTQARYTNWLRLAGAGVLAAIVAAGWWWMR